MPVHPSEAKLRRHPSPGMRLSVQLLGEGNPVAFAGAALGIAWAGPGRPKAKLRVSDMAGYGLAVFDELLERGLSMEEIFKAATPAVHLLMDHDPTDEEVKEALGNSQPARAPD